MTVRLAGIDTPETSKKKRDPGQPYSQKAKKHLAGLILNKVVEIKGYGLGPYNRIFIYRDNHNTLSESPVVRLTEVRIFPHVYEGRVKEPLMRISEGLPQSVGNTGKHTKKYEIARSDEKKEREPVGKRLSLASMGSDREEKLERIKSLAEGGTVEDIKALSVALRDKDPKVKEEAVNALKKMGSDITDEGKVDDVYDSAEGEGKEGAQPALTVASGPGTSAQINLTNDVPVRGVQFTLNGAQPTEVRTTSRTEGFFATHDKKSGKVILVSLSGKTIAPGTGPIAEVVGAYRGTAHQVSGVVIGK